MAALAVVFAHVSDITNDFRPETAANAFAFGQAGVDFFFVISGFIISSVVSKAQHTGEFVRNRIIRIFPFYWGFTVIGYLMIRLKGEAAPTTLAVIKSVFGLPQYPSPILGVGWSLEHEFIFYALVSCLLLVKRQQSLLPVMVGLAILSTAANLVFPHIDGRDYHLLSLYHVQFLLGVVLYRVQHHVSYKNWVMMLLAGILIFPSAAYILHALYGSAIPTQPYGLVGLIRVALFGSASFLVLGAFLALEYQRAGLFKSPVFRSLELIGAASYALYLSHTLVFAVLGKVLARIWPHFFPVELAVAVAVVAAVAFALLFYHYVERPVGRALREARPGIPPVDGPA